MGVYLTPIIVKKTLTLKQLMGRTLAVDGNGQLHEFLALVRRHDGSLLTDKQGNVTSHLVGLAFRVTRLLCDYGVRPVYVFDGAPPKLKEKTIAERREAREKARVEWKRALEARDYARAWHKAVVTGRLSKEMVNDAKRLLTLIGVPWAQAPSEGEAQAAYMCAREAVWAAASKDYDSILFGAPKLLRFLTISGSEFLPSKGVARLLKPELIDVREFLSAIGLTREQLVDAAILVGTDFNEGVAGVGPKTAIKLLREYGSLEALPDNLRGRLPSTYGEIRQVYLNPEVTDKVDVSFRGPDLEGLRSFLIEEKDFSKETVDRITSRLTGADSSPIQSDLASWMEREA